MPTIKIITTNPIVPVRSSPSDSEFHITIDRFGQEEDVTGASFTEPIDLETTDLTSRQMSRSLGKQSHSARLSNPSTKFDRQPKIAVKRSYKFGRCTAHRISVVSTYYHDAVQVHRRISVLAIDRPYTLRTVSVIHFYRAMHFSAKRGIAIACRLSARPSVCDVGEL